MARHSAGHSFRECMLLVNPRHLSRQPPRISPVPAYGLSPRSDRFLFCGFPLTMRFWLGTLRQWHWISSALCLMGMLLFAFTGITLNHAAQIEAKAQVTTRLEQLPPMLQQQLLDAAPTAGMPTALANWLESTLDIRLGGREAEWSDRELYIGLPRPGGDAWLSLDIESGELEYESTDRGWIAYLNDLHKGRHSGEAWS